MIIDTSDSATIIKYDKNSLENFFSEFSKKYVNFAENNLIIDFSDFKGVKKENILLFLQHSNSHKNNGMSFVFVIKEIEIDNLPDEITLAPTVHEANDIIEMEIIEKEIGI